MLLPADSEIKQDSLKFLLKLPSLLLEKKFKLYISSRFLYISKMVLLSGSVALLIYVIFYSIFDTDKSKEQLAINIMIFFMIPILYLSTFWFRWSRRVTTYSKLFQISILISSGVYAITTDSEYSLLGILTLQLLAIHFDTSFLVFIVVVCTSIAMFIIW